MQFGFRKRLGTCDALLTITNVVQKALDSGCEVHMIGLDFSAAFDRVNHQALVFKIRHLGLAGTFLSILIEFLTDRVQRLLLMITIALGEMSYLVFLMGVCLALCF